MNWIRSGILGVLISMSISFLTITLYVLRDSSVSINGQELLVQLVISVLMGCVMGLASMIFTFNHIPVTFQLGIHFLCVTCCVGVGGYLGDWFRLDDLSQVLQIFSVQVLVYIILWIIFFLMTKRDVRQINETLKRKREGKA